jgi:hypothetical protein
MSPVGLRPDQGRAGDAQQQLKTTDPTSRQRGTLLHATVYVFKQFADCTGTDCNKMGLRVQEMYTHILQMSKTATYNYGFHKIKNFEFGVAFSGIMLVWKFAKIRPAVLQLKHADTRPY